MKLSVILFILFLITSLFSFADRIPVPGKSADIDENYLTVDSVSGEMIACDQILIVFQPDVTRQQQEKILSSIGGDIIGGVPSLDIYQVEIKNPDCSVKTVNQICEQLQKNLKIVLASARKENDDRIPKVNTKTYVKRKSSLNMEATDRAIEPDDSNSINGALSENKNSLAACQKQIRQFYPNKHGQILFRIYLSPGGDVTNVKTLKSDLKDDKIINCFEYKMKSWDGFPEETQRYERQVEFSVKY
jgi:hypothetical protein